MRTDKNYFITALFDLLQGLDYLWLKATLERPEMTAGQSDIDLFIKTRDLPDVLLFIQRHERLAQIKLTDKKTVVFLQLTFADGSTLKVDLLNRLVRKQWIYLSEDYIFSHRIWSNGVATYSPELLLEHVLLFNFLNHSGLPPKYVSYFEAMQEPQQAQLLVLSTINTGRAFCPFVKWRFFLTPTAKN